MWSRPRRLAWVGAKTTFIGRQGTARKSLQGRTGRHPPTAYYWGNDTHCLGWAKACSGGPLAGSDVEALAEDAGCDCTGEQDGPDHLGGTDEGRRLSRSGEGCDCLKTDRLHNRTPETGGEKEMTGMGVTIWLRKTSFGLGTTSSSERSGPNPLITIQARGFRKRRTLKPDRSLATAFKELALTPTASFPSPSASRRRLDRPLRHLRETPRDHRNRRPKGRDAHPLPLSQPTHNAGNS